MKLIIGLIVLIFLLSFSIATSNILIAKDVRMANTHVIPIEGKSWNVKNKTVTLQLLSNRDAFLLAKFDDQSLNYTVSVWNDQGTLLGTIPLDNPSKLPPTESKGEKYSNSHFSVMIGKDWIRPKMKIQFSSSNLLKSDFILPNIGQDIEMKMLLLPFYLFGANDTNTKPLSVTGAIGKSITDELIEKWSISSLDVQPHSIKRVNWPYFILAPGGNGTPAKKILNMNEKRYGFEILDTLINLCVSIKNANGDTQSPIIYYSPLIGLGSNGKYDGPGGGVGSIGGGVGVGDYSYSGIFIHEAGHSFGLLHAGESYDINEYPYVNGSLLGSEWGYDKNHKEFLTINIPTESEEYKNCKENNYVLDSNGKCVKQSVMQSGAGDQSNGYRYSMFGDYEEYVIQNYFGNSIYYNKETGKYQKYNKSSYQYYDYTPIPVKDGGIYSASLNEGTAVERDLNIYTIIFTHSHVDPTNLSQIYPILKGRGNLIRQFDPTNKTEMEIITPRKGQIPYYCDYSGCDYTLRVTYEDNSISHTLLKTGRRVSWNPSGNLKPGINNPSSGDSFMQITTNVRGEKRIIKVEVLDTPTGWIGIPSNPKIILSKSF